MNTRFGDARKNLEELSFYDIDILATEDPARWVTTCRPKGLFPGVSDIKTPTVRTFA
ncbi:MAG: hypothetical protein VB949_14880 [Pseudomonadales bacterium]